MPLDLVLLLVENRAGGKVELEVESSSTACLKQIVARKVGVLFDRRIIGDNSHFSVRERLSSHKIELMYKLAS